jgi:hypothetical protein
MLRKTNRNQFDPTLEVVDSGAITGRRARFGSKRKSRCCGGMSTLPTAFHSAKIAYGRFETRRPVEPAGEDRKRRLLDAQREYQTATPGGRRHLIGSSEAQEDGTVGNTPMPRSAPPRFPTVRFTYTSSFQYSLTSYLRTSSTQVVPSPCRGISRS